MITYADHKLWGMAGGQLEYVSQKLEWRKLEGDSGRWYQVMVIRFTDHDLRAHPLNTDKELVDGIYYDLEFPIQG